MTDDLIARLEAATEGSEELDIAIWDQIESWPAGHHPDWRIAPNGREIHATMFAPGYTTSIDGALTLIPEGWAWFVEWIGTPFTEGAARLWIPSQRTRGLETEQFQTEAKTPALALCIAALRARQAQAGQ